jgi:SpoVK/Ycf46/Vps4 family AAA+-type ATPase
LAANGVSVSTGYILYGPPGTGKTIMIRALAGTLGIPCFAVKIPELKSVYINESAQHINTLFQRARAAAKGSASGLALICLDEIDALMSPRTETSLYRSGDNNTSVTTFLSELDGLARDRSVIVIGTTNKDPKNPRELDEAIVRSGRLGTHIRIGLPDTKKREQVASMHIRKKPLYNGMISLPAFIASHSDGWSPADIAEVIQKVTRQLIVTQHSSSNPTQNQGSNNEAIKQSFELAIQEQNKEKKLAAHYS